MTILDTLFETVHALPAPGRIRAQPIQVLALGLSRSGTDSLRAALLDLGYDHTYHGWDTLASPTDHVIWHRLAMKKWRGGPDSIIAAAEFDLVLGESVAVTDMPAVAFAAELVAAYPDAKVVLNTRRDVDGWYQSHLETFVVWERDWGMWLRSWFEPHLYWVQHSFVRTIFPWFYRGSFVSNGKWVYKEHCALIREVVPSHRLLEWSIEDGWKPLCEFLGKEVPTKEFPSGNMKSDFARKVTEPAMAADKKAYRNMALVSGFLGAMVAMVAFWMSRM